MQSACVCPRHLPEELPEEGIVTRVTHRDGEIVRTAYEVFPGITLLYNDVHTQGTLRSCETRDGIFEINHCREGRIECQSGDTYFYLMPGDLSVGSPADLAYGSYFPLRHYHGITVRVEIDRAPCCLSCFLQDVNISPAELAKRFAQAGKCVITRESDAVAHIFSELYTVPQAIRRGYHKVKILELFLFLSTMPLIQDGRGCVPVSKNHARLAKATAAYLSAHMEQRVTMRQLEQVLHQSATQIKTSFKAVYGNSIYAYIRAQKMQAAAEVLVSTEETVLAVAGRFGYDNASKFAKAFTEVMGLSPTAYRKRQAQLVQS